MFARTTTFHAQPGTLDAGIVYVRDAVMPVAACARGYVGLSMLVNRELDRGIVATAWSSQGCRDASAAQLQPVRSQAGAILGAVMRVQEWEIAVLRRDRPSAPGNCVYVAWSYADPARLDGAVEVYRVASLPALEELPGFCSASLFVDRAAGHTVCSASYEPGAHCGTSRAAAATVVADWAAAIGSEVYDSGAFDLVLAHLRVPEMA